MAKDAKYNHTVSRLSYADDNESSSLNDLCSSDCTTDVSFGIVVYNEFAFLFAGPIPDKSADSTVMTD